MAELTTEQKIRYELTGNPFDDPHFAHQGPQVVRWLTGGTLPDAWVTFHPEDSQIVVRCAGCQTVLGSIPANYDREQASQAILGIRLAGHETHKPEGWPQMNIIPG